MLVQPTSFHCSFSMQLWSIWSLPFSPTWWLAEKFIFSFVWHTFLFCVFGKCVLGEDHLFELLCQNFSTFSHFWFFNIGSQNLQQSRPEVSQSVQPCIILRRMFFSHLFSASAVGVPSSSKGSWECWERCRKILSMEAWTEILWQFGKVWITRKLNFGTKSEDWRKKLWEWPGRRLPVLPVLSQTSATTSPVL